jgi:hypothetical protein
LMICHFENLKTINKPLMNVWQRHQTGIGSFFM